jgi:flagellar hook-length control protein FliK
MPVRAEETFEKRWLKSTQSGDDSGFYGELTEAETSETESVYMFASAPDGLDDTSVSFSTDARIFPLELINDDSGFATMVNTQEAGAVSEVISQMAASRTAAAPPQETADIADINVPRNVLLSEEQLSAVADKMELTDAESAQLYAKEIPVNAILRENPTSAQNSDVATEAGSSAAAVSEVISQMIASRTAASPPQETADINVPQNVLLSEEQLSVVADKMELTDAESAQLYAKEIPVNAIFQKNHISAQNSDHDAAANRGGGEAENEASPELKTTADADAVEISKRSAVSSKDDDLLLERIAAQALRPRDGVGSAKTSEHAGKTVNAAGSSVQSASGTAAKAESSAPARSATALDQDFIVELAGRIQAQIRGGREMIRIQLNPEELGRLEIHAENGRNGIIARIAAESADVKKLLEGNLENLHQTLEARGLKIDRLHIVVEDNAYAAFADGGRYGNAGTRPQNSETSEFSTSTGMGIESPQDDDSGDLSAQAEQRGVGFYTIG